MTGAKGERKLTGLAKKRQPGEGKPSNPPQEQGREEKFPVSEEAKRKRRPWMMSRGG